jgi:DsbC/DsbD-like thiol-disulfide interchange protein
MTQLSIISRALALLLLITIEAQVALAAQTVSESPADRQLISTQAAIPPPSFVVNSAPRGLPQSAPNIGVSGNLTPNNVKRGRTVQGTITMDIPAGYHVNSNHPLEQFLVATKLTVDAPPGIRLGPMAYPRAVLRTFKFSKSKVSVYEGRAVMRFSVMVPANAATGSVELKAHLRYQSCNDSLCFPPKTQEVNMNLGVVGASDSVKRISGEILGGG